MHQKPLHRILEIAFHFVEQEGFISLQSEKGGVLVSTATRVKNFNWDVDLLLSEESGNNATDCISWVQGWDIKNQTEDFSNRVYQIFDSSLVDLKNIPMICGVIPNFLYQGKELRKCKNSEYIGNLHEKFSGFVKLMKCDYNQEKEYSTFKCRDQSGNIIFFWANPSLGDKHKLSLGDCFTFKGTVVQRISSDYDNGLKATRLNRVKIIKNYGKPK